MTVAEQVISVFAGVKGYLDDIDLGKIKGFEKDIIEKIKNDGASPSLKDQFVFRIFGERYSTKRS